MNDKFLVFRGDDYYPAGGWGDYIGSSNDIRGAVLIAINTLDSEGHAPINGHCEWYHIVDIHAPGIVFQGVFEYAWIEVISDVPLDYESEHSTVAVNGVPIKVLAKVTCELVLRD